MCDPVVKVQQGFLKGKRVNGLNDQKYYEFIGVPYAKPPVDELRFKPPVEPEPWTGTRESLSPKNVNVCLQFDKRIRKVIGHEDSLYMNIYSPSVEESLPVMVYFHGGGFITGSGTDGRLGPAFAIQENVVLVTVNYRLGIFGFLELDVPEATGNMGLKDTVQALKWIQHNIKSFGGDPDNVTIFGISAGGAIVCHLMLSPMGKGLFHKGIAQSGSSLMHPVITKDNKKFAYDVARNLKANVSNDRELYDLLMNQPADKLTEKSKDLNNDETAKCSFILGFGPSVEKQFEGQDAFFIEKPIDIFKKGEFYKVPIIIGTCIYESMVSSVAAKSLIDKVVESRSLINKLPWKIDEKEYGKVEKELNDLYLKEYEDPDWFVIRFYCDFDFNGGIWLNTKLLAENEVPVYAYRFEFDGDLNMMKKLFNINRKGATHGDDYGYFFEDTTGILPKHCDERSALMRARFVKLWTNFAKYGNPTPDGEKLVPIKWEKFTRQNNCYLVIDEEMKMKKDLYPDRMQFYEKLFLKYD